MARVPVGDRRGSGRARAAVATTVDGMVRATRLNIPVPAILSAVAVAPVARAGSESRDDGSPTEPDVRDPSSETTVSWETSGDAPAKSSAAHEPHPSDGWEIMLSATKSRFAGSSKVASTYCGQIIYKTWWATIVGNASASYDSISNTLRWSQSTSPR